MNHNKKKIKQHRTKISDHDTRCTRSRTERYDEKVERCVVARKEAYFHGAK